MELFEPKLSLSAEPDGEFTLDSLTLMPNASYTARPAYLGIPASVRLTEEVLSVILPVQSRQGVSRQILTPVIHHLPNQKLGEEHGKTSVIAFLMLGESILGSADLSVAPVTKLLRAKNPVPLDTADWYAWVDTMPGGPRSFHVTGTVKLPSPGWDVRLEPASPQGINPRDLILELIVSRRLQRCPPRAVNVGARYDLDPYGSEYSTVTIRVPNGDDVQIAVETIS